MKNAFSGKAGALGLVLLGALVFLGGFTTRLLEESTGLKSRVGELEAQANVKELALVREALLEGAVIPMSTDSRDIVALREGYIREGKAFIEARLDDRILDLRRGGEILESVPIAATGREGSWWETPTGAYQALNREENHFSSIGGVWMPWSVQFYGNFFIHGWPYFSDERDVPSTYSGGCIRLSTEDAKKVYDFVVPGMPILVFGEKPETYQGPTLKARSGLISKVPDITAQSVLVAHVENGEVFLNKNATDILPVASLSKLMTAVVASELVNLERSIKITPTMLSATVQSVAFKPYTHYRAFDLLYPLLVQSSNGSAEALAGFLGRPSFVENMNRKAASLGMSGTRFVDPAGLEDGNVSTARDLLALLRHIFDARRFLFQITKGESYLAFGPAEFQGLHNFNDFASHPDIIGTKIGETIAAKQTSVTVWNFKTPSGRVPVAMIILGSDDHLKDEGIILSWIKANFDVVQ